MLLNSLRGFQVCSASLTVHSTTPELTSAAEGASASCNDTTHGSEIQAWPHLFIPEHTALERSPIQGSQRAEWAAPAGKQGGHTFTFALKGKLKKDPEVTRPLTGLGTDLSLFFLLRNPLALSSPNLESHTPIIPSYALPKAGLGLLPLRHSTNLPQRCLSQRQGASLPQQPACDERNRQHIQRDHWWQWEWRHIPLWVPSISSTEASSLEPHLRARAGDRDTEPTEGRLGNTGLQATGRGVGWLCSSPPAQTHVCPCLPSVTHHFSSLTAMGREGNPG